MSCVGAQHMHVARITSAVPLQHLNRGGLARPFGPSKANASPALHGQVAPRTASTFRCRFRSPATEITVVSVPG